jgi:hypothetical protein
MLHSRKLSDQGHKQGLVFSVCEGLGLKCEMSPIHQCLNSSSPHTGPVLEGCGTFKSQSPAGGTESLGVGEWRMGLAL